MEWLGHVGEASVADGTPLALTAKGAMAWRNFEGKRLGSPLALVAEAIQAVRASCQTNLVRAYPAYTTRSLATARSVACEAEACVAGADVDRRLPGPARPPGG